MTGTRLRSATVIGCGVIGTSIALALTRAGVDVALADLRPEPVALAARMGAGTALARSAVPADVVVVATPAHAVVEVLYEAQARGLGRAYTDVAGPKGPIWEEALLRGCDLLGWVPGHPVAGRELSGGPGAARADLLTGRPWILCPVPTTASDHLAAVEELVAQCGAVRHEMPPAVHDQAVASLSRPPLTVPATLAAPQVCAAPQPPALANGTRPTTPRTVGSHAGSEGGNLTRRVEAAADAASRVAVTLQDLHDP